MPRPSTADHGTNARYMCGCKCSPCKTAHATYMRGWRRKAGKLHPRQPFDYHGTIGGYTNHRCHCERCRKAWREYKRRVY